MAVAVLLLAARIAVGGGFLEGAPVERRIEFSGVDAIDIDAAHFTVEVLGAADLDTVTVVSRMSTRFHRFHAGHVAVERNDGVVLVSVRYDGRPLSRAAVTWGPRLLLQVPERTALAVTTTVGDVRIHDVAASNVTITTTAGDLYLSDVTATVDHHGPSPASSCWSASTARSASPPNPARSRCPIHADRSSPTPVASSACAASTATSASRPPTASR